MTGPAEPTPGPGRPPVPPAGGKPLWDSPPAEWGKPPPKPVRDGLAVAGLVVGVFAVLLCWTGLPGVLLGLGAAGLGLRGHQEARRGRAHNPGLATVSTVLGAVAVVGGVVALLLATR